MVLTVDTVSYELCCNKNTYFAGSNGRNYLGVYILSTSVISF